MTKPEDVFRVVAPRGGQPDPYAAYEICAVPPRPPCLACWIVASAVVSAVLGAAIMAAFVAWQVRP
jgi:hypothetical protein